MIPDDDKARFLAKLQGLAPNQSGCLIMPANFHGSQNYRSYKFYWYVSKGRWPGSLKKTCTTNNCVVHYKEQGYVLTPEDVEEIKTARDFRGVNKALAEKFGVSPARISQIRKS